MFFSGICSAEKSWNLLLSFEWEPRLSLSCKVSLNPSMMHFSCFLADLIITEIAVVDNILLRLAIGLRQLQFKGLHPWALTCLWCFFPFISGWLWMQRLVWQSTVSTEASFRRGPVRVSPLCMQIYPISLWVGGASGVYRVGGALLPYIFSAWHRLLRSLRHRADRTPRPHGHEQPRSCLPSQQGHYSTGVTCRGATHVAMTPICFHSRHSLQLRRPFLSVMACHSLERTQANPLYLPENLIS